MSLPPQSAVNKSVLASTTTGVPFASIYGGSSKWYETSLSMVPVYVCSDPPVHRLLGALGGDTPNSTLFKLIVLCAGCVRTVDLARGLIPPAGASLDYTAVAEGTGPYAGVVASTANITAHAANMVCFHCLMLIRGVVKSPALMERMKAKSELLYKGLYSVEEPAVTLLTPSQLEPFCDFLRRKDEAVMGVLMGHFSRELTNPKGLDPKNFAISNAAILLPLRYHGLGALTMLVRVMSVVQVDPNSMLQTFQGSVYASAITAVLHTLIVYTVTDDQTRNSLRAAYGVDAAAPATPQAYWQYARIFDEDCLGLVASKTHDTFMSLCLSIYNRLSADKIEGYRALSAGVTKEAESAYVEAFLEQYAAGFVGETMGSITDAAHKKLADKAAPVATTAPVAQATVVQPSASEDVDL